MVKALNSPVIVVWHVLIYLGNLSWKFIMHDPCCDMSDVEITNEIGYIH